MDKIMKLHESVQSLKGQIGVVNANRLNYVISLKKSKKKYKYGFNERKEFF